MLLQQMKSEQNELDSPFSNSNFVFTPTAAILMVNGSFFLDYLEKATPFLLVK